MSPAHTIRVNSDGALWADGAGCSCEFLTNMNVVLCVQEVVNSIYVMSYYINWINYLLDTRYMFVLGCITVSDIFCQGYMT